jgi:4-amino-4-deoxy-L-arabinose transferase-like glycosyltransferase
MESQVLSEPLGLLVVGLLTLAVADLRDEPTLGRCILVGALCGAIALVRAEQLALVTIVAVLVLLRRVDVGLPQRLTRSAITILACGLVIAPWAIFNGSRFKGWVLLSTNGGATLLAGNCSPTTYGGPRLGSFDEMCELGLSQSERTRGLDASERVAVSVQVALRNMADSVRRLPIVVLARIGRMLALFRPSQTVELTARWMLAPVAPIWAWVVSYWLIVVLAIAGVGTAIRTNGFVLPLVAPLLIATAVAAIAYGDPRYHAIADLGVIVLAAFGADRLLASTMRVDTG